MTSEAPIGGPAAEIQVFPMSTDFATGDGTIATHVGNVEHYDVMVTDADGVCLEEYEDLTEPQMRERLLELSCRFPGIAPNEDLIDQLDHDFERGRDDGPFDNIKDLFP